ncbi:MAG: CocE/NonD family hydrolase, partial [Candidatus Dormibacteraeota bacterium]|nr:CocE/NonD family hydrolase [Candidatus Dormibacteraeota bacterium]
MRRLVITALASAIAVSGAALLMPRATAHAQTQSWPTLTAFACAAGSDAQCRDYDVTARTDTTGDTATIFLEVEHATDSSGNIIPAPLILTYSPYSDLGRNGDAAHWNSLGYSRAYADVVGTGNSGGCWDYGGFAEKQSVYDVIETIAAQSWSNGKIGMIGGSYDGTTTYAAAVMHPPHLDTIVPEAAIDRWYDYAFANGVRYFYTTEPFGYEGPGTAGDEGIDTPAGFSFGLAIPPPIDEQDPNWATTVESKITVCTQVQDTMEGYSTTPDYDAFWQARDYLDGPPGAHQGLADVTIPVLVASNYGDWNVKQANGWQAFHKLTSSVFARMYFGSRWHGHGTPPNTATACDQFDSNDTTVDKWFAHWLQGANNGLESMPVVTTATTDSNGPTDDSYSCGPEPSPAQIPLYLEHNADGTWALSPDAADAPAGAPQATIDWLGTNTESN